MEKITLHYLGHACFRLDFGQWRTVLDPYHDGMVPGLPPLHAEAEEVLCSHQHDDHNFTQAVHLSHVRGFAPYEMTTLTVPHDGDGGRLRGMNTIRIFRYGGLRVAHLGDLGRPLTAEETEALSGLDCMLLPVGGYYTIDAQAAKAVVDVTRPRVIIPMHYRRGDVGFSEIGELSDFTDRFAEVRYEYSPLGLSRDTPRGVVVLTPELS